MSAGRSAAPPPDTGQSDGLRKPRPPDRPHSAQAGPRALDRAARRHIRRDDDTGVGWLGLALGLGLGLGLAGAAHIASSRESGVMGKATPERFLHGGKDPYATDSGGASANDNSSKE